MANINAPFGLKPVRRLDGGVVGRVNGGYTIANAYASAIGYGDVVQCDDTYQSLQSQGGTQPVAGPNIVIGVSTNRVQGVFAGCSYQDTQGNFIWSKNWIASTATLNSAGAQAEVYDDPSIVYQVQSDGTVLASSVGKFFTFAGNGAPNALGLSTLVLHQSSVTTTIGSSDFKVLNLVQRPGYSSVGIYGILEVVFTNHNLSTPVGSL